MENRIRRKLVRLFLFFVQKSLRLCKFSSNERYRNFSLWYFKQLGVVFDGKPKYINYDVDFDLTKPGLIHVGENTVIAKGTTVLTHDYSIECGLISIGKTDDDYEMQFLKEVRIGRNSFIGYNCLILPGARIGDNCIIGSGSVVHGVIPDNMIACGNPAKVICKTTDWATKKYVEHQYVNGTPKKKNDFHEDTSLQ